jgi:hypothetical protein
VRNVIHAELDSNSRELVRLLAEWSSCVRFAYSLFREGRNFRGIQFAAKEKYLSLNSRYIFAAVKDAHRKHKRTEDQPPIIFGGRATYERFTTGEISVAEWRFATDGKMYVRTELTKAETPCLSVKRAEDGFYLEVLIGNSGFVDRDIQTYPLSVPDKVAARLDCLLASGGAYKVRMRRKEITKYRVTLDFRVD